MLTNYVAKTTDKLVYLHMMESKATGQDYLHPFQSCIPLSNLFFSDESKVKKG